MYKKKQKAKPSVFLHCSPLALFVVRTNEDLRSEGQNNLSEQSELLF